MTEDYTDKIQELILLLKDNKPNDRSARDRYWAILITDLEKILAFYTYFCR